VHVYGEAPADLSTACAARGLALHALPWSERAGRVGLAKDAAYLIRPDGYVALAGAARATLETYLDGHGLRFV
jgi:hypothetical protein